MNATIVGLLGALAGSRGRRNSWGSGGWGHSRFAAPVRRRRTRGGGGLLGSALLAGAAYWFARRRKARSAGGFDARLSGREAVPEL
jgi:hypothetical protein